MSLILFIFFVVLNVVIWSLGLSYLVMGLIELIEDGDYNKLRKSLILSLCGVIITYTLSIWLKYLPL